MEISGTIIQILPEASGTSKAGNTWRKQEYILETQEQYPKKICFNLWGDKIDQSQIAVGEHLMVSFDLESRETNGRWYTDVRAWKVQKSGAPQAGRTSAPPTTGGGFPPTPPPLEPDTDDLPF